MTTETKTCQNRECGRDLRENSSFDDPNYCIDCGDLVVAFCPQPRSHLRRYSTPEERAANGEEFFKVPLCEEHEEKKIESLLFCADQCQGCGSSNYTYQRSDRGPWIVKCSADSTYDNPGLAGETYFDGLGRFMGCGTEYPVVAIPGRLAIWA